MTDHLLPSPAIQPTADAHAAEDGRPILFLHIPKTAGTSLFTTIGNLFGETQVEAVAMETQGRDERIARAAENADGRLACLYGHLPVDVIGHRLDRFRPFTILRHPVARVMSLFRFERANPDIAQFGLRPGFSFDEFLAVPPGAIESQITNGMTRMLAGDGTFTATGHPDYLRSADHPELIGKALDLLGRIDFGLAEDMAGTHRIIQHRWGVPFALDEMMLNTTSREGGGHAWPMIHAIIERNTLDLVLYEQAAALFRDRLARLAGTPAAPPALRMLFSPTLGAWARLDAVPGRQGFHAWDPSGFAWISEGPAARIHFVAPAPSARIRLRVLGIGKDYPVDQVQLQLGGRPLPFRITDPDGPWCTLETRLSGLADGVNVLAITVPRFVKVSDIQPDSVDRRRLGLAVAAIILMD